MILLADAIKLTDWLTVGVAALAAISSGFVAYFAYKFTRRTTWSATRSQSVARIFDGYDVLSSLRVEHWQQSHLLELPENYTAAVTMLATALGVLTPERQEELLLRERAVATRIFTLYEEAWYDCEEARGQEDMARIDFMSEVITYFTYQLMANPRLRYLWRANGGNLRIYIKKEARDLYEARSRNIGDGDMIGPFSSGQR